MFGSNSSVAKSLTPLGMVLPVSYKRFGNPDVSSSSPSKGPWMVCGHVVEFEIVFKL